MVRARAGAGVPAHTPGLFGRTMRAYVMRVCAYQPCVDVCDYMDMQRLHGWYAKYVLDIR